MFFSADKENQKETTEEVLLKPTKKIEPRNVRFGFPFPGMGTPTPLIEAC